MKKKTDLRVLRTKKMIIEGFITLIDEKGYEAITIQNIADQAMINRATFYAHFKDKLDLYEHVLEFAIDIFASILNTEQLVEGNFLKLKKVEFMLTSVFIKIRENKTFFLTLTEGTSALLFREKLSQLLTEQYQDVFNKLRITENDIEVPIDFIIEYMTSIFIGTVHWWVKSDSDFPPNHMSRLVIKLVGNGHLTVLGIDVEK